jgi:AcrR family transcriptional regulator
MSRPIEKREHIERGVVEVIARKGLRGTTIQDIAAAAGVSPGLLYRYWENRDALAAEVYLEHYQALLERLGRRAVGETGFWGRLGVMVRGFLEFADENPTVLKFLLLSQHDLQPGIPMEKGIKSFMLTLIEMGAADGSIRRSDPNLAIQFILGIVLQPVVGALYGDLPQPLVQYHEPIMAALRRVFVDGELRGNNVN